MCSYDGAGALGCAVAAVEELPRGLEDRVDALEQLAVGDLAPEVPPEHLDRVQPRAVGRQVQEDQPARGAAQHGLDLLVLVRARVVPGDVDGLAGVLHEQRPEQLGHPLAPLARPRRHDGLAGVPVDRAQAVARVLDRLFLTAYSGPGLVIACCGRFSAMPPARSRRWTLGTLIRRPVASAKWSARRAAVQSENGRPRLRGRCRTTCKRRSRYAGVIFGGAPSAAPPRAARRTDRRLPRPRSGPA